MKHCLDCEHELVDGDPDLCDECVTPDDYDEVMTREENAMYALPAWYPGEREIASRSGE